MRLSSFIFLEGDLIQLALCAGITLEFRKDTTHPPTNFILESYGKEARATQLQVY